jgi:hypothetical protein
MGAAALQSLQGRHLKLGRRAAAIKVLPSSLASDPERLRRLEREARAASALNHPAIVTIYDIDEHEGTRYIAMELVEGETLRQRLAKGPLETREALRLAAAIAEGLARAHEEGIVHRDLKPDNVMITRDGRPKLVDFGLAKQMPASEVADQSELSTLSHATREGVVLGTAPYMSPEQAAGRSVDHLSDQFSFGVMLYEMLCGGRPFQGESIAALQSAILRDAPPPLRSQRPGIPRPVEAVVERCLQKDTEKRYASTGELREALHLCLESLALPRGLRFGARALVAAAAGLVLVGGGLAWVAFRNDVVRFMERHTLAEIDRHSEAGALYEAFRLARQVQEKLPGDPEVRKRIDRITLPVSIVTEPAGAEVEITGYASAPDAPWVRLGRTPLQGIRIPYALVHWKISKPGYATFEGAPMGQRPLVAFARGFTLDAEGSRPDGMVRIPGGPYERLHFPPVELEDYWIDWYEVTNRQFKAFVDAGGYEKDQFSDIVRVSNFGRQGPAPVGSHPGMGDFGTYDMAGNVKEWCWNESRAGRFILGGSWADPTYMFRIDADARPPLSREPSHGFRCALYGRPLDEALLAPLTPSYLTARTQPANDESFSAYRRIYAYERTSLEPTTESTDETSPHWRRETVSFRAAYGGERVLAHLFLPRNAEPPYQTVVWFPGDDAFFLPAGEALASPYLFDFIPRSGRALVYPVYKGMYERRIPFSFAPTSGAT